MLWQIKSRNAQDCDVANRGIAHTQAQVWPQAHVGLHGDGAWMDLWGRTRTGPEGGEVERAIFDTHERGDRRCLRALHQPGNRQCQACWQG